MEKVDEKKETAEKKNHKKEFVKIIAGILLILAVSFLVFLFVKNIGKFQYEGMKFEKVKVGELNFYQTNLPTIQNGKSLDLNIYFRNDPKNIYEIPFDGNVSTRDVMVINSTNDFVCNGDGSIGVGNIVINFGYLGIESIQDKNASCDEKGRYLFLEMDVGNETKIVQNLKTCYTMTINNCEILIATERFLLQKVKQTNDLIKQQN